MVESKLRDNINSFLPVLPSLGYFTDIHHCIFHGITNTTRLSASLNTTDGLVAYEFIPDAGEASPNFKYYHIKFNGGPIKSFSMLLFTFAFALVMLC